MTEIYHKDQERITFHVDEEGKKYAEILGWTVQDIDPDEVRMVYRVSDGEGGLREVPIEVFHDFIASHGFDGTLEDLKVHEKVQLFMARLSAKARRGGL